ncbi:MAG: Rieske 2Fe-2S domain-containing protein [Deltaproteobacteria bacterium]|nr:Rieske 2Fe-2S domain-containing protein [Deltaproteobacteria bacterium]
MRRRKLIKTAGVLGLGTLLSNGSIFLPGTSYAFQEHGKAKLLGDDDKPLKASSLKPKENYIFFYPFRATPCLLVDLGEKVAAQQVPTADGGMFDWKGGAGKSGGLVAFTAICSHMQSHPTEFFSPIQYDEKLGNIHCCVHRSLFEAKGGGKVLTKPAEKPLAMITLEWDKASDEITATGVLGPDTFDLFFRQFKLDIRARYGSTMNAKQSVESCPVQTLAKYSGTVLACPNIPLE